MKYQIRRIPIEFSTGKIIEFLSQPLCKILRIDAWAKPISGPQREIEAVVICLERWGESKGPERLHKLVILEEGQEWSYVTNFEPVLSRRNSFFCGGTEYFVFSL